MQDIIVTAQRREQRLNDVGIAVVVASGDDLLARGVTSTEDLSKIVPGLTAAQTSFGNTVLTLRGVGFYESSLAAVSPIAIYQDEVPIPFTRLAVGTELDIQRVEVLKGPQGTLYGSGTTGGTVNYVTNRPTADLKAGLNVGLGRFLDTDVQGFVSGPITDTLRIRVAARSNQSDGWQKSVSRDDTLGAKRLLVGRVLLDWDAGEALRFEFSANGFIDKSDNLALSATSRRPTIPALAPPGQLAATLTPPGDNRLADWDVDKEFRRDNRYYRLALKSTYALGDAVDLIALTSFQRFRQDMLSDGDGTTAQAAAPLQTGFAKSFAQELRLQGEAGSINYVVGANYSHDVIRDKLVYLNNNDQSAFYAFGPLRFSTVGFQNRQTADTYAGFASADYEIIPGLTIQGGLRYTRQDRDFAGCLTSEGTLNDGLPPFSTFINTTFAGVPGTPIGPFGCATFNPATNSVGEFQNQLDEDNLSWRGSVDYKLNERSLIYASISRGYKQGSFGNVGATLATQYVPAKQETLLSYEAGAKLSLANRMVQLNTAVFYYDYGDKQLRGKFRDPVTLGVFEALYNIPESRVYGGEVELFVRPTTGLTVQGQITYSNSKIQSSFANLTPNGSPTNFQGESFELTPKWSGGGSINYETPITTDHDVFGGLDLTYQGKQHGGYGRDPIYDVASYTLLDARLGIAMHDDSWRANIWVRNLTDKYYWMNANYLTEFTYRQNGMPRTYGITLQARF